MDISVAPPPNAVDSLDSMILKPPELISESVDSVEHRSASYTSKHHSIPEQSDSDLEITFDNTKDHPHFRRPRARRQIPIVRPSVLPTPPTASTLNPSQGDYGRGPCLSVTTPASGATGPRSQREPSPILSFILNTKAMNTANEQYLDTHFSPDYISPLVLTEMRQHSSEVQKSIRQRSTITNQNPLTYSMTTESRILSQTLQQQKGRRQTQQNTRAFQHKYRSTPDDGLTRLHTVSSRDTLKQSVASTTDPTQNHATIETFENVAITPCLSHVQYSVPPTPSVLAKGSQPTASTTGDDKPTSPDRLHSIGTQIETSPHSSCIPLDELLEANILFDPGDSFDTSNGFNLDDYGSRLEHPASCSDGGLEDDDGNDDDIVITDFCPGSRPQSHTLPATDDLNSSKSIYYTSISNSCDMSALLSGNIALETRSKDLAKQLKQQKRLSYGREGPRHHRTTSSVDAMEGNESTSTSVPSRYYNPYLDQKCRVCHSFGHTASECTYDVDYFQCAVCGLPGHACSGQCPERYCYKCFVKHPVSEACLPQNRLGVGSSRENYEGLMVNPLCGLCGSTSHDTLHCGWDPTSADAQTVLAHIKCFVCGSYGHLSCTLQSGIPTTTTTTVNNNHHNSTYADTLSIHKTCLNCGGSNHLVDECLYVTKFNIIKFDKGKDTSRVLKGRGACLACGRLGHQSKVCPHRTCTLCKSTGHGRDQCPHSRHRRRADTNVILRNSRANNLKSSPFGNHHTTQGRIQRIRHGYGPTRSGSIAGSQTSSSPKRHGRRYRDDSQGDSQASLTELAKRSQRRRKQKKLRPMSLLYK